MDGCFEAVGEDDVRSLPLVQLSARHASKHSRFGGSGKTHRPSLRKNPARASARGLGSDAPRQRGYYARERASSSSTPWIRFTTAEGSGT